MEAFEESGIWWTPDNEAKKVPGILRFAQPDGLELQLIGALGRGIQLVDEPYPAILGFAEKAGRSHDRGLPSSRYSDQYAWSQLFWKACPLCM